MDIMMRLKGAGFSVIANEFRQREQRLGGGLPLRDFVEIVLQGLPKPKSREETAANVSALIDLFDDIDINGDGTMEFDEFTSFCVDAGMIAMRGQTTQRKHRYTRQPRHVIKTANGAVGIERVKWSPRFQRFLVLEHNAHSVKLFDGHGRLVADVAPQSALQSVVPSSAAASTPALVALGEETPRDNASPDRSKRPSPEKTRKSRAGRGDHDAPRTARTQGLDNGAGTATAAARQNNSGVFILDAVFVPQISVSRDQYD
ncbi:hypothetical protein PINS_up016048 [Pythium insidiosum]|nr:hypothetical protein PINS_up016048 [Pythium insidiosum]